MKKTKEKYISYEKSTGKWKVTIKGKTIGRYKTLEEAIVARDKALKNPLSVTDKSTFADLFNIFMDKKINQDGVGDSSIKCYQAKYRLYCQDIANKRVTELRQGDYQAVLNQVKGKSESVISTLRLIMVGICEIAIDREIITRNYASKIKVVKSQSLRLATDKVLTDEEIQVLFNADDCQEKDIAVCLLFTGWRIGELLALSPKNIDLENKMFLCVGSKTNSSKYRNVPIHSHIYPIIEKYCNKAGKTKKLFNRTERQIEYYFEKLFGRYKTVYDRELPKHTPHHTRHTFRSRCYALGIPDCYAERLCGWSNGKNSAMNGIYLHLKPELLRLNLERVYYNTDSNAVVEHINVEQTNVAMM